MSEVFPDMFGRTTTIHCYFQFECPVRCQGRGGFVDCLQHVLRNHLDVCFASFTPLDNDDFNLLAQAVVALRNDAPCPDRDAQWQAMLDHGARQDMFAKAYSPLPGNRPPCVFSPISSGTQSPAMPGPSSSGLPSPMVAGPSSGMSSPMVIGFPTPSPILRPRQPSVQPQQMMRGASRQRSVQPPAISRQRSVSRPRSPVRDPRLARSAEPTRRGAFASSSAGRDRSRAASPARSRSRSRDRQEKSFPDLPRLAPPKPAEGLLLSLLEQAGRNFPDGLWQELLLPAPAWIEEVKNLRLRSPNQNDHGVAVIGLDNALGGCLKILANNILQAAEGVHLASKYLARMLWDKVDLTEKITQSLRFACNCSFALVPVLPAFAGIKVSKFDFFALRFPVATGGGVEKDPVTPRIILALKESNSLRWLFTHMNHAHMLLEAMQPETTGYNVRWDRIAMINEKLRHVLDCAHRECDNLRIAMVREATSREC